jgi:hypothetical protein
MNNISAHSIHYIWELVESINPPMARSSHDISRVSQNSFYLWGGEHHPRTPIDSNLYVLTLPVCEEQREVAVAWRAVKYSDNSSPPPSPRIAHCQTAVDSKLYVFGGRASVSMNEEPFNDLHYFDTLTSCWSGPILPAAGTVAPSPRSFHKMVSIGPIIYIFGGCVEEGRASDLFAFDTNTSLWTQLPSCDQICGRGGSSFAVVHNNESLIVTTGYSGYENNDIYLYHIATQNWTVVTRTRAEKLDDSDSMYFRPRSVCPSFTLQTGGFMFMFGGEVNTSDRGHEGAGDFASDIICIDCRVEGNVKLLETVNVSEGGRCPTGRGWTSMAHMPHDVDSLGENVASTSSTLVFILGSLLF